VHVAARVRIYVRFPRKLTALVALSVTAITLGGIASCGPDDPDPAATPTAAATPTPLAATGGKVKVTGALGKEPKVDVPKPYAVEKTTVTVEKPGKGAKLATGDSVKVQYIGIVGTTAKVFSSSWTGTTVPTMSLAPGGVIDGLRSGLIGQRVGSRVTVAIPPGEGYGPAGQPEIEVTGADTLVFVVDILKDVKPLTTITGTMAETKAGFPDVKLSKGQPSGLTFAGKTPTKADSQVLIKGSGPKVTAKSALTIRYLAASYRTKKVFESAYPSKSSTLDVTAQLPAGLKEQLVGKRMGDRVIAVLPKALAGATQLPEGVQDSDTLVMLIDILAVA
jgi:peptidylprolyl isomerase